MICEGCAKKKIPREKVRLTFSSRQSPVEAAQPGLVFLVASCRSQRWSRSSAPRRLSASARRPPSSWLTFGFKNILALLASFLSFGLGKTRLTTCITAIKISHPETQRPTTTTQMATKAFLYCNASVSWKSECFSLWTRIVTTKVQVIFLF